MDENNVQVSSTSNDGKVNVTAKTTRKAPNSLKGMVGFRNLIFSKNWIILIGLYLLGSAIAFYYENKDYFSPGGHVYVQYTEEDLPTLDEQIRIRLDSKLRDFYYMDTKNTSILGMFVMQKFKELNVVLKATADTVSEVGNFLAKFWATIPEVYDKTYEFVTGDPLDKLWGEMQDTWKWITGKGWAIK